jgi:quercetin dioxygenase-like cupin family protein
MPSCRHLARGRIPIIAIVLAASPGMAVLGQTDVVAGGKGERSIVSASRLAVTNARAQTELIQLVVDFEPSAWTSLHTHGGQAINLVLNGEVTLRHGGMMRPHSAGQSWTDSTHQVHAAGNTGSTRARLLTNFLLPKGAPAITVVQESQFGPTVTYEAKFTLPPLPAEADIVQQVADLSPGWRVERRSSGFIANMVMEGEVTYDTISRS